MYEIKKIFPASLAKYSAFIAAITVFILGFVNFILHLMGIGVSEYNISWDQQLTILLASVIFFAFFFWVIAYIFATIYNIMTSKSKGVMIEFKLADKKLLEELKDDKQEIKDEKDAKEEKFVV